MLSRTRVLPLLIVFLVITALGMEWIWRDSRAYFNSPLPISADRAEFSIPPGASFKAVVDSLKAAQILDRPYYFYLEAKRLGLANKIKAGDYELSRGITPAMLLDMFVEGRSMQHTLTIVEGSTVREILRRFSENPYIVHTLQDTNSANLLNAIGRPGDNPEGLFFPDTYRFRTNTTDAEILRHAFDRMTAKLAKAWEERDPDLPYKSPYEALTMASIVEKETAETSERAQIAGVFVRRLQQNMMLQTDPTVIYALGEQYAGNLHREDLQIDSLYNTYKVKGLTPSPIAAAGIAAIEAALHPALGDALYFVARGDGSHQFSATLAEHNNAVSRFQRGGK